MIEKEVMEKANYCLSCINKPCMKGCPLNNDITSFIKCIKENNYKEAYKILTNTTVFSPICGRICPHENQCQGSCVRGIKSIPVSIGDLEAFIGDEAIRNGWNIDGAENTKYSVAIIGAGPAGLTAAAFLRINGIGVTIYEKKDHLGGLLSYGIPEFRLPKKIVDETIERIIDLGITVKYNEELGKNLSLEYLKHNYDAILIAIGANLSNKLTISGYDLEGVYGANELLEYNPNINYDGKTVIVIGAGGVAMDISRTIKRNKATRVLVLCRSEKVRATEREYTEAKEDGVEILFNSVVTCINGKNKKIESVNIFNSNTNENMTVQCDYVVSAIGSHTDIDLLNSLNLKLDDKGKIINENTHTSEENIFCAGDVSSNNNTVAWASRLGRNAAYEIIDYLEK